jgi:hypothetical protein
MIGIKGQILREGQIDSFRISNYILLNLTSQSDPAPGEPLQFEWFELQFEWFTTCSFTLLHHFVNV